LIEDIENQINVIENIKDNIAENKEELK